MWWLAFVSYADAAAKCPNSGCYRHNTPSFLQLQEPQQAISLTTEAARPSKALKRDDGGFAMYNLQYKAGHFVCSKCDTGACPTCSTICDLSSCIGEFFTQECWCRKDSQVKLKRPLWFYREYDSRFMLQETVKRTFCDSDCSGGLCDTDRLQCKKREEACRPWWWCDLPPPKEDVHDNWPTGEEYTSAPMFLQKQESEGTALVSLNTRVEHAKSAAGVDRALQLETNDKHLYGFENGEWECSRASLPPQVQDEQTLMWVDRGYIVFDSPACKGGEFKKTCFCWDEVKRLKGEDPLTSELVCDDSCGLGACAGNTCGAGPPAAPEPEAPPPPLDPVEAEAAKANELRASDNKMSPFA